jgi:hypothetical protein
MSQSKDISTFSTIVDSVQLKAHNSHKTKTQSINFTSLTSSDVSVPIATVDDDEITSYPSLYFYKQTLKDLPDKGLINGKPCWALYYMRHAEIALKDVKTRLRSELVEREYAIGIAKNMALKAMDAATDKTIDSDIEEKALQYADKAALFAKQAEKLSEKSCLHLSKDFDLDDELWGDQLYDAEYNLVRIHDTYNDKKTPDSIKTTVTDMGAVWAPKKHPRRRRRRTRRSRKVKQCISFETDEICGSGSGSGSGK